MLEQKGKLNTITSTTSENAFRRQEEFDTLCTVGKGLWNPSLGTGQLFGMGIKPVKQKTGCTKVKDSNTGDTK